MVDKRTWKEFRDTKLLWFINTILHVFGWAIVIEIEDEVVTDVYPARVSFRGFSEKSNTAGYIGLSEYMCENCEQLLKESKE